MLSVGWNELRVAFRKHIAVVGDNSSPSHSLLRFYAIECGLKSVYLRRYNLNTTEEITDEEFRKSHDLMGLVKELKLPAALSGTSPFFHLRRDKTSWPISRAHEAWRYGAVIELEDEQQLINWLDQLNGWIQENT